MLEGDNSAQEVTDGHDFAPGSSHVPPATDGVPPERDTVPRSTRLSPQPGNTPSWRDMPQSTMMAQVLGALLLICLGLLLGTTWTIQAVHPKLKRQAEERRRLNQEWATIYSIRTRQATCIHCGFPQTDVGWYFEQAPIEDLPDDD